MTWSYALQLALLVTLVAFLWRAYWRRRDARARPTFGKVASTLLAIIILMVVPLDDVSHLAFLGLQIERRTEEAEKVSNQLQEQIQVSKELQAQIQAALSTQFFTLLGSCDKEQVVFLLDAKLSPNATDARGRTALGAAISQCNDTSVVAIFAERGADFSLRDRLGLTPLTYALPRGPEMVRAVLDAKPAKGAPANPLEMNEQGDSLLHLVSVLPGVPAEVAQLLIADEQVLVDAPNSRGETPLMTACWADRSDLVAELISSGAELNKQDHYGWSPIMYAAAGGSGVVQQLLGEKGVDPDLRSKHPTNRRIKVRRGHIRLRRIEVEDVPWPRDTTALMIAAKRGDLSLVTALTARADKSVRNEEGKSASDYAHELQDQELSRKLLELGEPAK